MDNAIIWYAYVHAASNGNGINLNKLLNGLTNYWGTILMDIEGMFEENPDNLVTKSRKLE